jgi:hypothetical protein
MNNSELVTKYNYDAFVPEKFGPWLRFDASPPLGEVAPDFPLWELDGAERREVLSKIIDGLGGGRDLEAWVEDSPLVEVELD